MAGGKRRNGGKNNNSSSSSSTPSGNSSSSSPSWQNWNSDATRKKYATIVAGLSVGIAGLSFLLHRSPGLVEEIVDGRMYAKLQAHVDILEHELRTKLNETVSLAYETEKKTRPGYTMARDHNATGQYPVVLIPGKIFFSIRHIVRTYCYFH